MFCSSCGKKIALNNKYCKYCGSSQIADADSLEKSNVWTCNFCGQEFKTKKKLDNHEKTCIKNPLLFKKNIKIFKLSKIFFGLWFFTIIIFLLFIFLFQKDYLSTLDSSTLPYYVFFGDIIVGFVSFSIASVFLALDNSYGKYKHLGFFNKFFRFLFSLIFLPFVVMKSFFGFIFGLFVLLPIWSLALLPLLFIFGFIRPSTPVSGNSMNPTILDQEQVELSSFTFLNKYFLKPKRGDIVTFESGRTSSSDGEIVSYIKRIVALEGDEVTIRDGYLYVNGQLVKEPYTAKPRSTFGGSFLADCKTIKIPNDYYFVLGDNRKRSRDSREVGLVSINEIDSILPVSKQSEYQDRLRDASSDGLDHGLSSFNIDDYYQRINKIREDEKLKPLKRNEKLEKAALARAKSIIENNEVISLGDKNSSKYPYSKAIKDAGYYNITIGEIVTTGYYDAQELSDYWLDYETKKSILDKDYQDTGIASFVGKIDDCEVQVIVQEFGGYLPPNYDKTNIEGWEKTLNRLREIQSSWQGCKDWGKTYEDNKYECNRINEIINTRISRIDAAVSRMKKNQWLTSTESQWLEQDDSLYYEQENLATKLNSL